LELRLLEMTSSVETMIYEATDSLVNQNIELANGVIANDDLVDDMELEIEEDCMKLLALQSPLAADLRVVGTVLKVITDLERMADHAVNIARVTLRICDEPLIKPLIDIPYMAHEVQKMVGDSIDTLIRRDLQMAHQVISKDDEVDLLYSMLFHELIEMVLEEDDVRKAIQAINLLFVARFLERIADHATNICERVIYMVTGDRLKS
jgi:phosphate transport system protein